MSTKCLPASPRHNAAHKHHRGHEHKAKPSARSPDNSPARCSITARREAAPAVSPIALPAQIHPVVVPVPVPGAARAPQILLHLAGRDLRRPRQVHDLAALLLKEVELALPVVTDDEGVHVELVYIGLLLAPALLGDDQVDVADGLERLLAPKMAVVDFKPPNNGCIATVDATACTER